MIKETLIAVTMYTNISLTSVGIVPTPTVVLSQDNVIAKQELDLTNRISGYPEGSQIFADNILLSLHYLKGDVNSLRVSKESSRQARTINGPQDIDWEKARKPFDVSFILDPGQTFAFHPEALADFNNFKYSTNSRFSIDQGYKSLNGLPGNGVCHIASLINMASTKAGLKTISKVNHDFAVIPDIPREYGSSIYSTSGEQNLYIKNNLDVPVRFEFKANSDKVTLSILK